MATQREYLAGSVAASDNSHTFTEPADKHGDDPKRQESAPTGRTITGIKWFFCYTSLLSTVFLFALDGTIASLLFRPLSWHYPLTSTETGRF